MKSILCLISILSVGVAAAETVVFSDSMPFSQSYASGSGLTVMVPSSTFSTTLPSFDTSLGTLTGVSVEWSMQGDFSATTGPMGGGMSLTYVGPRYVNGVDIGVLGGGGGNGGGPNSPFSFNFASPTLVTALDTGSTLFQDLAASAPLSTSWDISLNYAGLPDFTNLSLGGAATATVTYTYTPVPETSATALLALGGVALSVCRGRRAAGAI